MDLSLINLPDEKIVEICEKLDDRSLSRLVRSHGKFYQLCNKIIKKRQLGAIRDLDIYSGQFVGHSIPGAQITFNKKYMDYNISLKILKTKDDNFYIQQFIPVF